MPERFVLLIAYHFPPENAIGGRRPFRFFRYLSESGYRCHVITAADQKGHQHPDIEHIPDPFHLFQRRSIVWQLERAIRRFILPGVTGIGWSRLVYRAVTRFIQSHPDAEISIISTFPPLGVHLAAWRLSRNPRLRWIADFRDPMPDDSHHPGCRTTIAKIVYRKLERSFMTQSALVIANTNATRDLWKKKFPAQADKIHLIWNGFDPNEQTKPLPIPKRGYKLYSHAGSLYGGRSISRILESVSRLIQAGRLSASSLRIRFVGPVESKLLPSESLVKNAQEAGWLELFPQLVSQQEAKELIQTSDGLLLIQPHSSMQVPAKLFEYIQVGRPVLAFVPPHSSVEHILQNTEIHYRCAYTDLSDDLFDEAVESYFSLNTEPRPAGKWFDENFDARNQTMALARMIDSLGCEK